VALQSEQLEDEVHVEQPSEHGSQVVVAPEPTLPIAGKQSVQVVAVAAESYVQVLQFSVQATQLRAVIINSI